MFRTKTLALALSLAVPLAAAAVPTFVSSTSYAESAQPRGTFTGTFQRYLLRPNGKPMGLMLADGTFIASPPHAIAKDAPILTTGTKLEIDGISVRTPTGTLVRGAVVKANGAVILDASKHGHKHDGEGHERHAKRELTAQVGAGQIAAIVSGPKGHVRALVLTDGTTATGHGLEGFGLKIGDRISVAGMGGVYPLGKSIRVEKVTMPNGEVREVPRGDLGDRKRKPAAG